MLPCCVGGLSDIVQVNGKPAVRVHLNTAWLAGHSAPYSLFNVRLEETQSFTIVTEASQLPLPLPTETAEKLAKSTPKPITMEMRQGVPTRRLAKKTPHRHSNVTSPAAQSLVLVHGYCASETPYSLEDFTDYLVFQDFKKSRPNDYFACLIAQQAKDLPSFGGIGHSHGGVSLLHLYSYYFSGLDESVRNLHVNMFLL